MALSKPALLLTALLLSTEGWAQAPPGSTPPAAPEQQLTVRVTVPTIVGVVSDYARILLSRDKDKLKTLTGKRESRTSNPVIVLTITLPPGISTKKREQSAEKK